MVWSQAVNKSITVCMHVFLLHVTTKDWKKSLSSVEIDQYELGQSLFNYNIASEQILILNYYFLKIHYLIAYCGTSNDAYCGTSNDVNDCNGEIYLL